MSSSSSIVRNYSGVDGSDVVRGFSGEFRRVLNGTSVEDLQTRCIENRAFRRVLHTDAVHGLQTAVMRVRYVEDRDLGYEVHRNVTQVFLGVSGVGEVHMTYPDGDVVAVPLRPWGMVVVPRGVRHNVLNVDRQHNDDLLFATMYISGPPPHAIAEVQMTKRESPPGDDDADAGGYGGRSSESDFTESGSFSGSEADADDGDDLE